jgi:hypothetical protein
MSLQLSFEFLHFHTDVILNSDIRTALQSEAALEQDFVLCRLTKHATCNTVHNLKVLVIAVFA